MLWQDQCAERRICRDAFSFIYQRFRIIFMSDTATSFMGRHEFLIRRLHSLSGLVPVGAYMMVHLLVNASLMDGAGSFQRNVNQIHSLGSALPLVEWLFIFIPILFHAVVGIWIIRSGSSNIAKYRYTSNYRYHLQRWTGVVAVLFIFFHVFHLHGWFHSEYWLNKIAHPLGMASFRPFNAASSLALALKGVAWPIFYFIGVMSCVYHFANGIWTFGITWGIWISPKAQQRASSVCTVIGLVFAAVGLSALYGAITVDIDEARRIEDAFYESRVASGEILPTPHKRIDSTIVQLAPVNPQQSQLQGSGAQDNSSSPDHATNPRSPEPGQH